MAPYGSLEAQEPTSSPIPTTVLTGQAQLLEMRLYQQHAWRSHGMASSGQLEAQEQISSRIPMMELFGLAPLLETPPLQHNALRSRHHICQKSP